MDDPLDTPTIRPGDPLQDATTGTTPRAPPPPRRSPASPPHSPRLNSHDPPHRPSNTRAGSSNSSAYHEQASRARSPPAGRRSPGASSGLTGAAGSQTRPASLVHAQSQHQIPTAGELERFEALCRRLYYEKDGNAARQVDSLLQRLPAAFRTSYARTMATVRSAFHRDEEQRRRAEVETLLATTQPGSTVKRHLAISPDSTSVAALRSVAAQRVRRAKLRDFIAANCTAAMPGTHPFFKALFAALWLQALDERKGGAGERCVEWVVDVAVFTEAGGNEVWASEAVEALKGVLGMTDRIRETSQTDTMRTSVLGSSAASETSSVLGGDPVIAPVIFDHHESPVAPVGDGAPGHRKQPPPVPPHRGSGSLRARAGSDPFLNPQEKVSRRPHAQPHPHPQPETQAVSPPASVSPLPSPSSHSVPLLSVASPVSPVPPAAPTAPSAAAAQFRVLTLPGNLSNPELRALCRLFPPFISSPARSSARLPPRAGGRTPAQLEAGEAGRAARVGHGELRVGQASRDEGWRGSWWERFVLWLRALFGLL